MEIKQTSVYSRWFRRLKDVQGKARINIALRRCSLSGTAVGDIKSVGSGVFELRIHFGPGYRIYFLLKPEKLMLLMLGGSKKSQAQDIEKAKNLAKQLKEEGLWQ